MLGNVHDEGGWPGIVDEVVADPVRFPGVSLRGIAAQPRVEHRVAEHRTGRDMVRVPILPVRQRDGPRPPPPDQLGRSQGVVVTLADSPIGQTEVLAPRRPEYDARGFCFGDPLPGCAVAAHLTAGQIAEPHAMAECRLLGEGPAQADLQIVGMRTESQQIQVHAVQPFVRVNANSSSPLSGSPRHCRSMIRAAR